MQVARWQHAAAYGRGSVIGGNDDISRAAQSESVVHIEDRTEVVVRVSHALPGGISAVASGVTGVIRISVPEHQKRGHRLWYDKVGDDPREVAVPVSRGYAPP